MSPTSVCVCVRACRPVRGRVSAWLRSLAASPFIPVVVVSKKQDSWVAAFVHVGDCRLPSWRVRLVGKDELAAQRCRHREERHTAASEEAGARKTARRVGSTRMQADACKRGPLHYLPPFPVWALLVLLCSLEPTFWGPGEPWEWSWSGIAVSRTAASSELRGPSVSTLSLWLLWCACHPGAVSLQGLGQLATLCHARRCGPTSLPELRSCSHGMAKAGHAGGCIG